MIKKRVSRPERTQDSAVSRLEGVETSDTISEYEIDAMLAENSQQNPAPKKSSRRKKGAHIASNPSVNPNQGATSVVDGLRVANSRIHQTVEEEARRRGIRLPSGVSAENLEIPSYSSVISAEHHASEDSSYFQDKIQRDLQNPAPMLLKTLGKEAGTRRKDSSKAERAPQSRKGEKSARPEKAEKPAKTEKPERSEKPRKSEKPVEKSAEPKSRGKERSESCQKTKAPEIPAHEELLRQHAHALKLIQQLQQQLETIQSQLLPVVAANVTPVEVEPEPEVLSPVKPVTPKTPKVPKAPKPERPHRDFESESEFEWEEVDTFEPEIETVSDRKPEKKSKFSGKKPEPEEKSKPVKAAAPAVKPVKTPRPERPEKPEPSDVLDDTAKNVQKEERRKFFSSSAFAKMGLSREMLAAIFDAQYMTPSPIQLEFIPEALTGEDVMGQAQTGTGKTAAFAIPILQTVKFDENSYDPQAMILVPTRELAVQVKDEFEKLAKYSDLDCIALYGGKPLPQQVQQLRQGVDIVVGTPGRVMDHIKRGSLKLGNLKIVVLDEADRMLDIGFRPDIEKILRACPQSRQSMLLSATIPPPVEAIARKYMRDPKILNCSPGDIASETIEQFYFTVDPELKFELLEKLLKREEPKQAIIFCRTKRGTEKIATRLSRDFSDVEAIHGDLQQRRRDRVMQAFRSGKARFLVATDVVGRGIDVSGISHIINYDIPKFCDDYVHRVGRTGRMGREGVAYTFVAPEEGNELTRIEMRINRQLKRDEMSGFRSLGTLAAHDETPVQDDSSEKKEPSAPSRRGRRTRTAL